MTDGIYDDVLLPVSSPKQRKAIILKSLNPKWSWNKAIMEAGYAASGAGSVQRDLEPWKPLADLCTAAREQWEAEQAEARKPSNLTPEKVLAALRAIAYCNPEDFTEPDGKGGITVHFDRMSRDDWLAVSEISCDPVTVGTGDKKQVIGYRTRIKFLNRNSALVDIGKHLAMFPTPTMAAKSKPDNTEPETGKDVQKSIEDLFRQSAEDPGEA